MDIQKVTDASFAPYGRVVTTVDCSEVLKGMEKTPLPEDDKIYVASDQALEALPVCKTIRNYFYGGLPIQIGYCNGHNQKLNGLEYHRSSEINMAATDLILLLGRQQDITAEGYYDTSKVEAFLVPKGTVIEVYATTLHFAPCGVDGAGFRCVVVLPKGTNTAIDFDYQKTGENRMLRAKNKWLLAHPEAGIEGAYQGLVGENITI